MQVQAWAEGAKLQHAVMSERHAELFSKEGILHSHNASFGLQNRPFWSSKRPISETLDMLIAKTLYINAIQKSIKQLLLLLYLPPSSSAPCDASWLLRESHSYRCIAYPACFSDTLYIHRSSKKHLLLSDCQCCLSLWQTNYCGITFDMKRAENDKT